MGRRVYGFGDRGIKNRAALEQSFILWLAIPLAIVGFVTDNFMEILKLVAGVAVLGAACWIVYMGFGLMIAGLHWLSRRVWGHFLAWFTASRRWRPQRSR
jgi:hypothetical protein